MAVIIKSNGEESDVKIETLKQMQDWVEGRIHFLYVQGGHYLIVNKDGFELGLKHNPRASNIANQLVCGTAILCEKHEIY